jgi:type I site-specific restriction endonuclease
MLGPKGSLNAINMLDEDVQLFMYSFPDADEEEMQEQCRNTVLEYEESMQVWEEIGDTEELDSSSTDSEEGDELTGEDLLQDLDKAPMANFPPVASMAGSSYIDRSKRILRQTILVSSIAAEI